MTAPNPAPASGKRRTLTLEILKSVLLQCIAHTESMVGKVGEVRGYRDAVMALPNRDLLRGLPLEIRSFLERELDAMEPGCECHQEQGDSPCPKHGMESA